MPVGVVSRDAEARAVADFLVPASTVPSALVEGEAGIGETALWLAAVALARERGFQVLAAHPAAAESVLVYASLVPAVNDFRRRDCKTGGVQAAMRGEPTMKPSRLPDVSRRCGSTRGVRAALTAPGSEVRFAVPGRPRRRHRIHWRGWGSTSRCQLERVSMPGFQAHSCCTRWSGQVSSATPRGRTSGTPL
jgi:hypothetical protein